MGAGSAAYTGVMKLPLLSLLGAVSLGMAGCAGEPAEPVHTGQRVMLTLGQALTPGPSAIAALETRAARTAGAPVRYVASVSTLAHVVDLHCGAPAACDAALSRLRSDTPYIIDARFDQRRRPSGT